MEVQTENKTHRRVLSEINVTPFVDVMLVLLIIFMVTAPMMQQGLKIELPETSSAGLSVPDNPLILMIDKNQDMFIGSSSVTLPELGQKTKAILQSRKDKQVYIQADQSVEYGAVAKALARIQGAGVYEVSLITTFQSP